MIERRVEAQVKQCPDFRASSKAEFPASMPGLRQYGSCWQALTSNLLVAHMLSLRRVVEVVRAISSSQLSKATCLGHIRRPHEALQAWEVAASVHLLAPPAFHAKETGLRVGRHNHWLHTLNNGPLTLKFLQQKGCDFFKLTAPERYSSGESFRQFSGPSGR